MSTVISRLQQHTSLQHPAGLGKVVVNDKPKPDDRELVNITASIFFDGTNNNRTNSNIRMAHAGEKYAVVNGKKVALQGSYAIFYSNVAIMEYVNLIEDENTEVSVYVEGIATEDDQADDWRAGVFGTGKTGVIAKVTKGIRKMTALVERALSGPVVPQRKLNKLLVNVVGYSRGAAAARHFVARRTRDFFPEHSSLAGSLDVAAENITINFVGLYDTVSSYGGEGNLMAQLGRKLFRSSFDDDVAELHLAIGAHATQVVQLAAADEYRKNFASTTIASSVYAGAGLEVSLPGAHGDIGGGQLEKEVERLYVEDYELHRLVQEGWYLPSQLHQDEYGHIYRGERTLTNHYQFVPLAIMVAVAQQGGPHVPMTFESLSGRFAAYEVVEKLRPLRDKMRQYVLSRPGPQAAHAPGNPAKPLARNDDRSNYRAAEYELPADYWWVRNQYLHRSAEKGTVEAWVMGGRETNGLPDRQIIQDTTP